MDMSRLVIYIDSLDMMRLGELLGKFCLLMAALVILGLSVVKVRAQGTEIELGFSQAVEIEGEVLSEEVEQEEVMVEPVNYYLPYPGVLPDHPLYFLKMLRDRVREWTLFDPARKAEYYSLLADKRLGAGRILVEGGKEELGVETYWKSARYLQKSVELTEQLKAEGREMGDLANKLEQASQKHLEVLERSAAEKSSIRGQIEEIKKVVELGREKILQVLGR